MYDFSASTTAQPDTLYKADIGPLSIWLRYTHREWQVASETGGDERRSRPLTAVRGKRAAAAREWARWPTETADMSVRLGPVLPDRPTLVKPDSSLSMLAGSSALFFVGVPVNVRVLVGPKETPLCDIPTVTLSNTWFGDPVSGELSYALKTRALRELSDAEPRPNVATCPLAVKNSSSSMLHFDRFNLHVEHLEIFLGQSRLWTNRVAVTFRGEDQMSQVNISRAPREIETITAKLAEPRSPAERSFVKKSFGVLKNLAGY